MQIIPAILTNDPEEFENLLARISHKFDRVQIDFIDGEYATNKTVLPSQVHSDLKMDAHLMIVEKNLQEYLKDRNKFDRVIVQMESISNPEDFDCLALDIHSPIEAIKSYLPKLKLVNLMSIEPGTGGQKLNSKILEKISNLSNLRNLGDFRIAVDGGIEQEYLAKLESLGVDEVVVGAKRVLSW